MKTTVALAAAALLVLAPGCVTDNDAAYDYEADAYDAPAEAHVTVDEAAGAEVDVVYIEPASDVDVTYAAAPPAAETVVLVPPVPERLNAIGFLSPQLHKKLYVQNQTYERTLADTFRVQCSFKNMTDESVTILARTQYFDEDRLHMEGPSTWQMLFIPAQGIETYRSYSRGDDAMYYYVEVMAP